MYNLKWAKGVNKTAYWGKIAKRKKHDGMINKYTTFVLSYRNQYEKLCSLILENNQYYIVDKRPIEIIKDSIRFYGGTFEGIEKSAREALGNIRIPPILICQAQGLYWFSTSDSTNEDCAWFAFHDIKQYRKINSKMIVITFRNNVELPVEISIAQMEKRLSNTYSFMQIRDSRTSGQFHIENPQNINEISYDPVKKHYYIKENEEKYM